MIKIKHLILTSFLLISLNANAGLIYDNGFDVNAVVASTKTSTSVNEYALWDDFSLSTNSKITGFTFLMNGDANFGPTTIEIRQNNSGDLGTSVFRTTVFGTAINQTLLGSFYSQFDVTLSVFSDLSLSTGNYWISFTNMTFQGTAAGSFGNYEMKQSVNAPAVPVFARGDYDVPGEYVPFQVHGNSIAVSEPSTFILMALAVSLLLRRRARA